jgi:ABC-type nitrate/sulfonate/bicarbonate transport system permease component
MRKSRGVVLSALGLAAFFLGWEVLARTTGSSLLIPPPSSLPKALLSEIKAGYWEQMIVRSLSHYAIGLAIGTLLGVTFGVVSALSVTTESLLAWVVRMLRPIPSIAWIPFTIIWFGVTETAAAFIISITVFWLNFYATFAAVRSVDKDLLEMGAAFGQSGLSARVFKIVLPSASPGILGGVRAGLGQGWMSVVAAELFGIPGVGMRMMEASGLLATPIVLLYMVTIAALYGLTDFLFIRVQNRLLSWQR